MTNPKDALAQFIHEHVMQLSRRSEPFLTASQKKAVRIIQDYYWGKVSAQEGRIQGRYQPLLVGASGSGKSHAVREAARQLDVDFFHINLTDWIVRGAYTKPSTLDTIREFVERSQTGIIFLDEVDKLRANFVTTSSWNQSIATECFAFLDGKSALESLDWVKGTIHKLRYFLIVGAGSWHESLAESNRKMGFAHEETLTIREQIETIKQIPFELLARFSPDIVRIFYPTFDDFVRGFRMILDDAGFLSCPDSKLNALAQRGVNEGRGARSLESFATKMAIYKSKKMDKGHRLAMIPDNGNVQTSKSVTKFYDYAEVRKHFQNQCDEFAKAAFRLSYGIAKFPKFNAQLPQRILSLSEGLEVLANKLVCLARNFGSSNMSDLQASIADLRELSTKQLKEIHAQLPASISNLVTDFLFAHEVWQAEYTLLLELSHKN